MSARSLKHQNFCSVAEDHEAEVIPIFPAYAGYGNTPDEAA